MRGIFILLLFTAFIGGSLALYAWRTSRIGLGGAFEPVSRESFLLGNNVLLAAAAGTVFLGTLYPLVIDALGAGKISVGPQYFEAVFAPLMAPALFLMGVGPLARWKRASLPELAVQLRWALAVSLVLGLLSPLLFGNWSALVGFGLALAIWVVLSALLTLKGWKQTRAHYGMVVAHIGIAVFVVGVTVVKGYESHDDVRLKPGESAALAGYNFRLDDVTTERGPNYVAARGHVSVTRDGKAVTMLYPERRIYTVQEQVMTEAAIDPGWRGDHYVSLGEPVGTGGAWGVRVYVKPFIDWIWGGCLLMALGGFLAIADRRYRVVTAPARSPAPGTAPAGAD